eukprot:m.307910 g.307910  ORF g.307910 m.307910 type:complete len:297 (-) comp20607_c0_seq1:8-898(-)
MRDFARAAAQGAVSQPAQPLPKDTRESGTTKKMTVMRLSRRRIQRPVPSAAPVTSAPPRTPHAAGHVDLLPPEVLLHILKHLTDISDLCSAALVSRRWHAAARDTWSLGQAILRLSNPQWSSTRGFLSLRCDRRALGSHYLSAHDLARVRRFKTTRICLLGPNIHQTQMHFRQLCREVPDLCELGFSRFIPTPGALDIVVAELPRLRQVVLEECRLVMVADRLERLAQVPSLCLRRCSISLRQAVELFSHKLSHSITLQDPVGLSDADTKELLSTTPGLRVVWSESLPNSDAPGAQ